MPKLEMVTANKFCDNQKCPDHGHKDNIIRFGHSPKGVRRHRCKTCGVTFTDTKGTLFYDLVVPPERISSRHWQCLQKG